MRKCYLLFLIFCGSLTTLSADEAVFGEQFSMASNQEPKEIVIHNRVLLKVKGKPISLMDVVRKMDLLFTRQYPELASSKVARYQFYTVNWRHMLDTVIDDQLIMADAEEKKVEITDGDVREAMENLFGPDVVLNLEKFNLGFSETWDLVKTELIVNRMSQIMVRSKAQSDVGPKEVKKVYEKLVGSVPLQKKWIYQTLTVESPDEKSGKSVIEQAQKLLEGEKVAFSELPTHLKKEEGVTVRLSDEFERKEKELSLAHRAILETLAIGATSAPVSQIAKQDGTTLFRIFYLKKCEEEKRTPLSELEEKLSKELMQKATERYALAYTEKLRKHYGVTEEYIASMIPDRFAPFNLK